MAITIRPARPDDQAFAEAMCRRLVDFPLASWRSPEEIIEADRRVIEAFFAAPPEGQALLIAEVDAVRAGIAFLETPTDYFTRRPHAHLGVLCVTREHEGRGVGRALIDACIDWARAHGSDRLTLSAMVNNTRARALYSRQGFGEEYVRYVLPLDAGTRSGDAVRSGA
jgi:ribosomal protein S18 acetylase RimI-like enzyme